MTLNSGPLNSGPLNAAPAAPAAGETCTYTPPTSPSIDFSFTSPGYTPPAGNALDFPFVCTVEYDVYLDQNWRQLNPINLLDQNWIQDNAEDNYLDMNWAQETPDNVQDNYLDQNWQQFDQPDNIANNYLDQFWRTAQDDFLTNYRIYLDQNWQQPAGEPTTHHLDQNWAIRGLRESPLEIAYRLPVESEMEIIYRHNIESELGIIWGFGITSPLEVSMPLPVLIDPGSELIIPLGFKEPITSPLEVPYNIIQGRVDSPLTVEWDILDVIKVSSPLEVIYSLQDEASVITTEGVTVTLVKTGELIGIIQGSVEIAEGSFAWTGTIELADPNDFPKFDYNDEVELVIPDFLTPATTDTYNMVVDSKNLNRPQVGQFSATVRLVSQSAIYDTPRADPFTGNFTSDTLASDAVETILGTTVDFRPTDWLIPGNILGGEAASPAELAGQVAGATGGLLETKPDGTIYVRYLYPTPVADYETATPDHEFTEVDTILAKQEGYTAQAIVNRIRIRSTADSTFGDRIEYEQDEADGRKGILKVFPSPWRSVTVEATTSDPPVELTSLGVQTEQLEEFIEIKEGTGTIQKPIFGAPVATEFLTFNLGGVVIEDGSTTVTVTAPGADGYTLLRIVYNTRFVAYEAVSDDDRKAQFIVRDC